MTKSDAIDPLAILSVDNADQAKQFFYEAIDMGVDFKLQPNVSQGDISDLAPAVFLEPIPEKGQPIEKVINEFRNTYLPYSYNFSSPRFMGFPDAGNSVAALTGNIIADFLQQNMINQTFCSPSGTFAEINVIQWLRSVVGYKQPKSIDSIFDVGGVITGGGTTSNTIGILLAREHYVPKTMQNGVNGDGYYLVVPKGIGHYSVKSAQMWVGCGNRLIEVEINDFRYDLNDLRKKLTKYKGKIMGLVAYAGDSRTMTVDNLKAVAKLTREIDPNIWLHADACHGFSLGFSDKLRHKIAGIEEFDSITTDPHKVMNTPYTVSALLVKNPEDLLTAASLSDLIMHEQYAFGQATPFIGSKPWVSLKLWFALKNLGRSGFGNLIDQRHQLAVDFADMIDSADDFILLNKVDINSVAFMYTGAEKKLEVERLNNLNKAIHTQIIKEGKYHLHQFSIPDAGLIEKDAILYPLRYMSGNPNTTKRHLQEVLQYVRELGKKVRE